MRLPASLQKLDDRVLGNRLEPRLPGAAADGSRGGGVTTREVTSDQPAREPREPREKKQRDGSAAFGRVLATVYKVSRLVFLLLAIVMVLGITLTLAPSNPDNVIVRNALDLAGAAAGPFKDAFTQEDPERQTIVNNAVAAAVYVLTATLVRKLPTGTS